MVYIFNTNLKKENKVKIALRKIYGIGDQVASQLCAKVGISDSVRMNQLTHSQLEQLIYFMHQTGSLGSEVRQQKRKNVDRLIKIASYRGFRHREGLPSRGQRTHGNARTVRKIKTK